MIVFRTQLRCLEFSLIVYLVKLLQIIEVLQISGSCGLWNAGAYFGLGLISLAFLLLWQEGLQILSHHWHLCALFVNLTPYLLPVLACQGHSRVKMSHSRLQRYGLSLTLRRRSHIRLPRLSMLTHLLVVCHPRTMQILGCLRDGDAWLVHNICV